MQAVQWDLRARRIRETSSFFFFMIAVDRLTARVLPRLIVSVKCQGDVESISMHWVGVPLGLKVSLFVGGETATIIWLARAIVKINFTASFIT